MPQSTGGPRACSSGPGGPRDAHNNATRAYRDDGRPEAPGTDFGQHLERGVLYKKNVAICSPESAAFQIHLNVHEHIGES